MEKIQTYIKQFEYYKTLAEKAIAQCEADSLFEVKEEGTNSIAILMKHISGNMMSRWTNIFEEDGEKEWRNRDGEFMDEFKSKDELMEYWKKGWNVLFDTLNTLSEGDMERIIYIRKMGCTVHDAIIRQLCHYSYHIGQIVFIAKLINGNKFKSLSIPKDASKAYNKVRFDRVKSIKHFTQDMEDDTAV